MKPISTNRIIDYVENNIGEFHRRRLESLASLKLDKLLKSKNPYLFNPSSAVETKFEAKFRVQNFLGTTKIPV